MFCSDLRIRKAHKQHRCTSCGEVIEKGEKYCYWTSVEDSWFVNKLHMECYEMHMEDADGHSWEYDLYGHERPQGHYVGN